MTAARDPYAWPARGPGAPLAAAENTTADDAVADLAALAGDPHDAHLEADRVLCRFLGAQGFGRVADAYWKALARVGHVHR